jgi:DNA-binding transcriptional ArsR family regulator
MAMELPVSRPAVSQHLKVLKEAGLVSETPEGTRRIYRIDPRGLEVLRRYLDGFWGDVLEAFKKRVESNEGGQHGASES